MIHRDLREIIQQKATQMPVISVTGPRQSGKTTLAKQAFPNHTYINLENISDRLYATQDPEGFIHSCKEGAILDEVQNVPALFSAIQVETDRSGLNGQFILTGSQNFQLLQSISQSLAGRVAIYNLFPFTFSEIANSEFGSGDRDSYILNGFYPRIYDKHLSASKWLSDYIQTYIERDVRSVLNVGDLSRFQMFVNLCAGRCGQFINLSEMGNQLSISFHTIDSWISVLEASYIVFRLKPYHKNINKRLIKSPKLYFYDTGLACSLLGIRSVEQLQTHYASGALYENFVISEIYKQTAHRGIKPALSFWRDSSGNEVDCILESETNLNPIEIKLSRTIQPDFFKGLNLFSQLTGTPIENNYLVYGGDEVQQKYNRTILPWSKLDQIGHTQQ
jgi:uncharacterized protein